TGSRRSPARAGGACRRARARGRCGRGGRRRATSSATNIGRKDRISTRGGVLRVIAIVAVAVLAMTGGAGGAGAAAKIQAAAHAAENGRRAYNLSHWDEAIAGFEKAYQLSGDPALLFN